MQAALRSWVHRAASGSARGLRGIPAPALLSLLCASALSPLLATVAGIGGVAFAGSGILSSIGGGILSGIITDTLERVRSEDGQQESDEADGLDGLGQQVAAEIGRVLAAEDANAMALRAEIASLLAAVDAGGTMLRAAMEEQSGQVRSEVLAAIGVLGSDFAELGFLVQDVAQAAAVIQRTLDMQGADVRAIIDQNSRQSADIRLVREDVAAIARRADGGASSAGAGSAGYACVATVGRGGAGAPRWVHGCPYRGLLPFAESDTEVFYGRERLVAELAVTVAGQVASGGMVVVTGASGAGKSSLVRAGLLPALARGQQVAASAALSSPAPTLPTLPSTASSRRSPGTCCAP